MRYTASIAMLGTDDTNLVDQIAEMDHHHEEPLHKFSQRPSDFAGEAQSPNVKCGNLNLTNKFNEVDTDGACEDMWRIGHMHDDYNSASSFDEKHHDRENINDALPPTEEESKTTSTTQTATSSTHDTSSNHGEDSLSGVGSKYAIDSNISTTISVSSLQPRKTTKSSYISSKLDLVADYENLVVATFALSEWVAKVAEPDEVLELLRCRALHTIFTRTLSEMHESVKFEDDVLPSLLHLVGSIFLNFEIPPAIASSIRKNLEQVIRTARNASQSSIDTDKGLNDRVSRYIVSRIADAIDELRSCGKGKNAEQILRLDDEIDSLESSCQTSADAGIIELMKRRDANKIATEKASAVLSVAISRGCNGTEISNDIDEFSVNKEFILISLVGSSGLECMKRNKSSHEDLVRHVSSVSKQDADMYQNLKLDLSSFNSERVLIAERMEELRKALKCLEEDDIDLVAKITETESRIGELDLVRNEEISQLSMQLEATKQSLQFDKIINDLADSIKVYEESLRKAVTFSDVYVHCQNENDFLVHNKLSMYLIHAKNYFSSEFDFVDFIRNRVKKLEKEANCLEKEIDICQSLGMSATVSHLGDAITQLHQNISDDNAVLERVLEEADNFVSCLTSRIHDFVSCDHGPEEKYELGELHMVLIHDIARMAEMLGINNPQRLKSFSPSLKVHFPSIVTTCEFTPGSDNEYETIDSLRLEEPGNETSAFNSGINSSSSHTMSNTTPNHKLSHDHSEFSTNEGNPSMVSLTYDALRQDTPERLPYQHLTSRNSECSNSSDKIENSNEAKIALTQEQNRTSSGFKPTGLSGKSFRDILMTKQSLQLQVQDGKT